MDWCRCGKGWKTSEAIQRQGLGAGFQLSGHTPGMALGSVVKWAVGPYCGSGDASLIHDELIPTGIETGAQFIVPAGIHPSKHRVPTPQQGHLRATASCCRSVNSCGGAGALRSTSQSWRAEPLLQLARKPKWRILTKPGGRICSRNRRMNSMASSVMRFCLL